LPEPDEKKLIIPEIINPIIENPESQQSVEIEYFTYGDPQTPIKIE
jgi:hypothetical protein